MDPAIAAARAAGLRYVSHGEMGFTRRRRGKSFVLVDSGGQLVRDEEIQARVRHLAIPPAWERVWICRDEDGHLQATGFDVRGRKQYRYHPKWSERRNETKFHRMLAFAEALPTMRRAIRADMAKLGLPRERVVACVVELLERTLIRVGNAEYAKANDSYGLTTITKDHVTVTGSTIRFKFKGKSNKHHDIALHEPKAARIIRKCQDLPGHELFGYVDDDGKAHDITSADVNTYLATACCGEFTAKDFRTWGGTVLAFSRLREKPAPTSEREGKRIVVEVIKDVAEHLGNTPAMSRKYYVHPAVIAAYMDGTLGSAPKHKGAHDELAPPEADLIAFLKTRPAHTATRVRRTRNLKEDLRRSLKHSQRSKKSRTLE